MQRYSQTQRSTDSSATVYSPDLPHRMDECLETVADVLANIEIFFRSSCRTENRPKQGGGGRISNATTVRRESMSFPFHYLFSSTCCSFSSMVTMGVCGVFRYRFTVEVLHSISY